MNFHVLDIHAGEKEPTLAKSLKVAPRHRLFKQLWLVWHICVFRGDIVHFNYSGCHALVALAVLPKLGRQFFLTLHNGSQLSIHRALGTFARRLLSKAASKIDCVFSLCDDHVSLYRELGIGEARIVHTKSQIAAPNVAPGFVDDRHARIRVRHRYVVVSSGHVSRSYNFEFIVRFVNENPDCAGLLFFYGEHMDQAYLSKLQQQMTDPERFAIYFHQTEAVFLAALATADAYLRPTHIDSWGIAVADAISLGVPAIASNVCERATGAKIVNPLCYAEFDSAVRSSLLRSEATHQSSSNSESEKFFLAYTKRIRPHKSEIFNVHRDR